LVSNAKTAEKLEGGMLRVFFSNNNPVVLKKRYEMIK
jgi:hypothetical protein